MYHKAACGKIAARDARANQTEPPRGAVNRDSRIGIHVLVPCLAGGARHGADGARRKKRESDTKYAPRQRASQVANGYRRMGKIVNNEDFRNQLLRRRAQDLIHSRGQQWLLIIHNDYRDGPLGRRRRHCASGVDYFDRLIKGGCHGRRIWNDLLLFLLLLLWLGHIMSAAASAAQLRFQQPRGQRRR